MIMAAKTPKRACFVICIKNEGYEASLERRKIYQTLPDPDATKHHQIRVIDESGEDLSSFGLAIKHGIFGTSGKLCKGIVSLTAGRLRHSAANLQIWVQRKPGRVVEIAVRNSRMRLAVPALMAEEQR